MSAVETIRDIPVIVEHRKSCDPDYEPMIIDYDYTDSGFPFDNTRRSRDPLEDIAQRHPELAQHLQGFPRRSQRGRGDEQQDDDEFLRRRFERPFSGGRFERFGFPFDRDDFDREPQRYYEAYPEHFENFQNQHPQSPTHQQTHQQQQTPTQQNFQQQPQHSPQYSQQQQYHQPQYSNQQQYQPEYSQQQPSSQESQSQTQAPPLYQRRISQGTQTEEGEAAAQQTDLAEPEQKEEGGQTRGRPIQQSNTCDLGQSLPDKAVNDREQRSMSLPPENKRFTSSVNIPMGGHQGQENGGGKTTQSQGTSTGSTERVIPIHVEGRDDPIIPKNFSTTSSQPNPPHPQPERIFTDAPRPQPERIFGQRPEHFTQFVNRGGDPHSRFPSDWHHSFERDFPEEDFGFRRTGSPSRFSGGAKQTSPQQQQSHATPPQYHHKQESASQSHQQPPPKPQPQEQKPAQQSEAPQAPQPKSQKQPLGPIEQIQAIQKDVSNLIGQVEVFNGMPRDKNYLYLDEMLTRNLLKLDNVDTQGQDAIRQARKEAIKCIEKTISHLEAKAAANAAQKMEVEQHQSGQNEKMEAEPLQEPSGGMEVSPASSQQLKDEKEATPTPQEGTKLAEGIQQSKSGENVEKAQESVAATVEKNSEDPEKLDEESESNVENKATEVTTSEASTQKGASSGDAKDEKKDKKKTKKKANKEDKETKQ